MKRISFCVLWLWGCALLANAALPTQVTIVGATVFEIIANGAVTGTVGLRVGQRLPFVSAGDGYVMVRIGGLEGRVRAKFTDVPPDLAEPRPKPAPEVVAVAAPAQAPVPSLRRAAPRPDEPPTPVEEAISSKLVSLDGDSVRPFEPSRLSGVKYYAIYYSASWCGPCRQFTPELVDAYGKIKALYPEFELVFVNCDNSESEMNAYMRDDHMPWPALAWSERHSTRELTKYAGSGIPCLVLIDSNGKVLSDSFRWGQYVGPDTVLDDTWKILHDQRMASLAANR